MRNLCAALLALGCALVLLQPAAPGEALKIKKVVKDGLKLTKKYGYLLASRKKKLYAVPFPMPLPVFVKRQHIYHQVPIIPRYVQHPPGYGSPALASESASVYDPMSSMPSSASTVSAIYAALEPAGTRKRTKKISSSSSSSAGSASQDSSSTSEASGSSSSAGHNSPAKYLNQLAGILSQSVPIFGNAGNANRELFSKLMSGQAKMMTPTSLISAIKGPSSALLKYQQQQSDSASASTTSDADQDSKGESGSSASDSSSTSGASDTTKAPGESSATSPADSTRPAASEPRGRYRVPYAALRTMPYTMLADPRRIPGAMVASPVVSPMMAAMASAQSPVLMPRIPLGTLAAANPYLAMMDPQAAQLDLLDTQASEPGEQLSSGGGQAGAAEEQSAATDPNQLERRKQLLRLALLRERQEAERLLETRVALARAKQLSQQAPSQAQALQMMNLYRQQQAAQHVQQMRYLQLLQQQQQQQQQQQLQQNSIDYQ